jgi:phospholipase C
MSSPLQRTIVLERSTEVARPAAAVFIALAVLVASSSCRGGGAGAFLPSNQPSVVATGIRPNVPWGGKIKYIIIIFQENRTPDNLFRGLRGADTQSWGLTHTGGKVMLQPVSESAPYDLDHEHPGFTIEYNNGQMNGFDLEPTEGCKVVSQCPPPNRRAYAYVPRKEAQPYFDMAEQYGFGDRMFQTNQGPSFPAHQYIISGTSAIRDGSHLRAASNPFSPSGHPTGGCDSPKGSTVRLIDEAGNMNARMYPCFERLALMDLLDAKHVVWHYYQFAYAPNLWAAPDAIRHIHEEKHFQTEVAAPSTRVLSDILNGDLEPMSWVTPDVDDSDHALVTDGSGPSWVTSIVNAVGLSPYWKNTAIFITWDDWGGWYDHVKPPVRDSYELGFRVPLVVISPYAKKGYVSHSQHEFGSILKFAEETFGLGSLHTTDVGADDLSDFFNFNQKPRAFVPIHAPIGPLYFLHRKPPAGVPDDDF